MLKKEARKLFIGKRNDITDAQKMKWDDLILIRFQTVQLPFLHNVMSFYCIEEKKEVNSFILTDYLLFRNPSMQVSYPRMNVENNTMDAVIAPADSGFAENEFGITEPIGNEIIPADEIDLVLVPLLAIDKKGHRVGYGKGYYDRFLKDCKTDCIKVGVSYFQPIDNIDDAAEFDVPLDFCITPERIYVF